MKGNNTLHTNAIILSLETMKSQNNNCVNIRYKIKKIRAKKADLPCTTLTNIYNLLK